MERDWDQDLPSAIYSPNTCNSQGWPDQSKQPGPPPGLPCRWQAFSYLSHHCCFPVCTGKKLGGKWSQDSNPYTQAWDVSVPHSRLHTLPNIWPSKNLVSIWLCESFADGLLGAFFPGHGQGLCPVWALQVHCPGWDHRHITYYDHIGYLLESCGWDSSKPSALFSCDSGRRGPSPHSWPWGPPGCMCLPVVAAVGFLAWELPWGWTTLKG